MQQISPDFLDELRVPTRQRVELWEFFTSDETDFEDPSKAVLRVANVKHTFAELEYRARVTSRGDVRRFLDKQKNTVSLTLSNVDLEMTEFVSNYRLEGMWVQLRVPSTRAPGESLILFGGRCNKPDELDGQTCQLSIDQDFGGDEEEIPSRKLEVLCPLARDFKGVACRGAAALSTKSATYQAAATCNGTRRQCVDYGNEDNFAGCIFTPISGTFSYTVEEKKRFLLFFTKTKRRTVSAPWSSVSDFQQNTPIPEVAGIVQCEGVGVAHADTGTKVKFLQAFADGPVEAFYELRIRDKQYLPDPDNPNTELGTYGSQSQGASTQFSGAGKFSGTAYAEGEAIGSDPSDANDSQPTVTAIVKGRSNFDLPDLQGDFTLSGWSDCGPYMLRWYLINKAHLLESQIDNESVLTAGQRTFEPVIDDTGFEQAVLSSGLTGGVDFKSFASASGFGAKTVDKIALMLAQGKKVTGGYGQLVQAYYRYINQTAPPAFIVPNRKIRRRYTTNFRLDESTKLRDFIWDILLPSFNGRLVYSAAGKVQIRVDGPADSTYITTDTSIGVTPREIRVEDVTRWMRNFNALCLVGAHQKTAQVNRVLAVEYLALSPAITLTCAATSTLTATASGATLTGGSSAVPDAGTVTLGGTVSAGAEVAITVDGVAVEYTAESGDDRDAIAGLLAATINGHPILKRYIRALWDQTNSPSVIRIETKCGVLRLETDLTEDHVRGEEVIRIEAAFGGSSSYDRKVRDNSFKWPLGSRQSSVNRVEGNFRSAVHDWALTPISADATTHQKQTRRTKKEEINLSAVDNAHQAARLLKIALGKRRACDWFCSFGASADALLLDVGDVIAASHYSGKTYVRNVPVVIEDIIIDRNQDARIVGRLYKSEIYNDQVAELGTQILMPLQTGGASNTDTPPPNQPTAGGSSGSGLGGIFPRTEYPQGDGGYGSGGSGLGLGEIFQGL